MKLKRILMIIPQNTSGGAERVVCQLANNFAERGISVCLANFDSDTKFYPVSDKVIWVKMGLEYKTTRKFYKICEAPIIEARRFFRIRNLIKDFNPDVVLPFLEMAEVLTIPNCIMMRTPFCVSVRNDYNAYFRYMKLLSKLTYQKAKLVVCQTDAEEATVKKAVDCITTVIENPLDPDTYTESPYIGERRKVVINVGRLVSQKNQRLLIEAFAGLADKFSEYELHIFGTGELKDKLQIFIDELGMSGRVFLSCVVPNAIKENYDASLFVMSSDFEGFPNTLVEAMANGVPVISTDFSTRAARNLLCDGEIGKLVPVGDADALRIAIEETLSNPQLAQERANRGLYIRERLGTKKITNEWIQKIENALEGTHE